MLSSFKVAFCSVVCLSFAVSTSGQLCSSATNCNDCIRLPSNCVWCALANYTTGIQGQQRQRCIERDSPDNMCDPDSIEDPSGDSTILNNNVFGGNDFVQVSPQRFRLNLRPGEPQAITVSVRPANNFPVDIYFLMDQSFSMNDDLESLRMLASNLATAINGITTNFQLGFGSFVDKRRVPYISVETSRLIDPCQEDGVECEVTYSARHTLKLTSNADEFVRLVRDEIISGNLDSPEGGFDAMLQVIVCQDIIGWRENARHILVYLTDAGFHFAGDGKLGGVVIPNNGECSLRQDGRVFQYPNAETYDYPSVGQINSLLRQFDIIPIFAAEAAARPFYENLRQVLDSAFIGVLARDSSNIVDLIENTYNTISQTVRLVPEEVDGVTFGITPMCNNIDGSTCTGVQINQTATFNVSIMAQSCTDELMRGVNATIRIPGFGQFVVELSGVCDCECTSNRMIGDEFCNDGNGTLVCGLCECNPGWVGDTCECSSDNVTSSVDLCPLGPNDVICTSPERGTCVCNTCQCAQLDEDRRYFGPACQCDNFSCDRDNRGLVCGGSERGMCSCNQTCICLPRWTGRACDCDLEDQSCVSPLGLTCSNRGNCTCGECVCDREDLSGQFCEICTGNRADCPENPACTVFQDCVVCNTRPDGRNCSNINCTLTMISSEVDIDSTRMTSFCRFTQDDCAYQYFVGTTGVTFSSEGTIVQVMEVDCGDDGVEPWIIIVAILGGLILLAALILIIIRIIIELRYCVEFRQWKRELERARFAKNDNPLFQKATEDFVNPAYGK